MTPMRLLPEAEEELRDAARFYEAEQQGLGRALIQEGDVRVDSSLNTRWLRLSSVVKFESERSRAFHIASTTARGLTRSWSSPSGTAGENRGSGAVEGSRIKTRCTERRSAAS